jgi:hypothetical protein
VDTVLFGRDGALRALSEALERALDANGRIVIVSGEAGIGKSAVASAIAEQAERRGAAVTWGRAWEFADAPPYFPVWPCLRALGVASEPDAFKLWEQVATALAAAAERAPVVWILEDLHAADLATLDLLTFLTLPVRALRVLVVATVRTNDPRVGDRMQQRLTRIARDGTTVALDPLTERDIAGVLAETLGRDAPQSAVHKLFELTAGNPLFVVECARAFRAAGGVEGTLGTLPPTVRQVVLDRVALLPEATRDTLAAGAVLGRELAAATVARMMDVLPARAIDALLPALRAGLIAEVRPGQFVFVHALVRDAIEDALPETTRAQLHGRASAALATLGDRADVLVERARHSLAAARCGDPDEALAIARRAVELLEHDRAYDRAFELQGRVEQARADGLLPAATAEEQLRFAALARAAGRSDAARAPCEQVIAAARQGGDGELLARAALLLAADIRPGVVDARQVALLREARDAVGDGAPELACRVIARLSTALQPAEDQTELQALAREALRRARETGDGATVVDVLELAVFGIYYAPLAERVAWASELLERALAGGQLAKALSAYNWLWFLRVEGGDFAAFEQDAAAMLAISDEVGHPRHRWRPLLVASCAAITRGRFAESERHVTEASALAALTDDPTIELSLVTHAIRRASLSRRDEELPALLARLDDAVRGLVHADQMAGLFRASCAARRKDIDETRRMFAMLRPDQLGVTTARVQAAEVCALLGDEADCRRDRDALLALDAAETHGGVVTYCYEGPVGRVIGLLDAAVGDLASADRRLVLARTHALERGHAPWVAQLDFELAEVALRANRRSDARTYLDEAGRIARELGMTGLAGEPAPGPRADVLVLAREGEVWRVERGATAVRVRDSRGVQLLARLVERRGEEIHVLALASDEGASAPDSDSGELLDEAARKAYRARLAVLDDELAAAERAGAASRAGKLEREREALVGELARAAGLGGRTRRAGSATERARINVQRRLKDAVARITEADAELGAFVERSLRTGTFCCFG